MHVIWGGIRVNRHEITLNHVQDSYRNFSGPFDDVEEEQVSVWCQCVFNT